MHDLELDAYCTVCEEVSGVRTFKPHGLLLGRERDTPIHHSFIQSSSDAIANSLSANSANNGLDGLCCASYDEAGTN